MPEAGIASRVLCGECLNRFRSGLRFFLVSFLASFLAALLVVPLRARAWEDVPEFESLFEEEPDQFEGPDLLSSEYQSDILAYMKPEVWQHDWISRPRLLDLSVGSLSATQFLMDTRLKIHALVSENLEFRFLYLDDRDFEKKSIHHVLEVVYWPIRSLGISAYGDPDFSKRRNDTGLALTWRPAEFHEIRFFNTFVDVTRIKRNDRPDTFLDPDLPYSRGFVGRLWANPESGSKDFLQYAFRLDTRTRWLFPEQEFIHEFRKTFASVFFNRQISERVRLSGRAQFDDKREAREPSSGTSPVTVRDWRTRRFIAHARATIFGVGPRGDWDLTVGLMTALRWWQTEQGGARYRDFLPLVSLSMPGYRSGSRRDQWSIGIIETLHRSDGVAALFSSSEKPEASEFRLSVGYDFVFGEQATLRLQANGDLDEYGTPRAWEGGNGQLILRF
jgi:hypothetical protein